MAYFITKFSDTISNEIRSIMSTRYRAITRSVNKQFWDSISDSTHSLYVGSFGRGTAIKTSDIDILIELPEEEYRRFDSHTNNGQSKLLQALRNAILTHYPKTDIHADGQVVKVIFSDGMKFEILPAFKQYDNSYTYPDTNMGGHWLSTNPKAEQNAMQIKNKESNGLLLDTCRHIRYIRDNELSNCKLSGIVIDSFVYKAINNWHWPYEYNTSSKQGDYEKYLYDYCSNISLNGYNAFQLYAPGSGDYVYTENSIMSLTKVLNFMAK